jgi:arylsulfatase A-like enzyme
MSSFALPANYTPKAQIHTPRLPANVLYAQYRQKSYDYVDTEASLRERLVRQYQTITGIDNVLGTIRAKLAELEIDRNTVIVFASDHGIMAGEYGLGGKALNYEPCLRIPMIVMDPRIPKSHTGQRRAELVQSIDVAPTLLNVAGIAAPTMQGRSLLPLIRGESRNGGNMHSRRTSGPTPSAILVSKPCAPRNGSTTAILRRTARCSKVREKPQEIVSQRNRLASTRTG